MNCKNCSWYQQGACNAPSLVKLRCYIWRMKGGERKWQKGRENSLKKSVFLMPMFKMLTMKNKQ